MATYHSGETAQAGDIVKNINTNKVGVVHVVDQFPGGVGVANLAILGTSDVSPTKTGQAFHTGGVGVVFNQASDLAVNCDLLYRA